jgi:acetylornithine deacetylase/succinyl-diaminopimelate desuccinylase-like protein
MGVRGYAFLSLLLSFSWMLARESTGANVTGQFRLRHDPAVLEEYRRFLRIPNVPSDPANMRRNAEFILQMMKLRGIEGRLLDGESPDTSPAVFGEVKVPGASKTLLFYAHYDGQPVNPANWAPGLQPFVPVYITAPIESGGHVVADYKDGAPVDPDWRLTGRSSADDKAGVMTILNAYWALAEVKHRPGCNLKFFFEGEEEQGSPHLAQILARHKAELGGELWIVIDGPRHATGYKTVEFGVRGDVNIDLIVYGAKRPLHSGNYGNWAPNPALQLVKLLASMKEDNDHVLVAGFYDDVVPLTATEHEAIRKIPHLESALQDELAIATPDGMGQPFWELMMQPTLNINGIQSANVGEAASNIIPSKAEAVLDLRLVKGNSVDGQVRKVLDHIRAQGFQVIDHDPTDQERHRYPKLLKATVGPGYAAQRTPMDLPIASSVLNAVQGTSREPVIAIPSAGGSLPLVMFEQVLGVSVVTVPVVNYDNNQHAENENVRVRYLWEGIEEIGALMLIQ